MKGDDTRLGADVSRFVRLYTPGRSLWYGRLAFERMLFDRLAEMADPDAPRRFRRIERRAAKEFGQRYWAPPGGGVERLPDLGAATGR